MNHEDHLKKQIDQMGKVLGKILADLLRIKHQGDASMSIESIFVSLKTELDIDLEEIIECPTDQLIEKLSKEKGFSPLHMELFADILYNVEDGTYPTRQCDCLERALTLYEYAQMTDHNYSFERMNKINRIKTFLN